MAIATKATDNRDAQMIAFYREPHRIFAVARFDGTGFYCAHDGVTLDPRKGGFTHRVADIYRAQETAGYVPVGKCLVCSKSYAAHIRGLLLRETLQDHEDLDNIDPARLAGLADNTLLIAKHDFVE